MTALCVCVRACVRARALLYRQRPCDEPIPHPRSLKGFIVLDVNSESEQCRGRNPRDVLASKQASKQAKQ